MLKYRFKQDNGNDYPDWESNKFDKVFDIVGHNSLAREKLNYEQGIVKNVHYGDVLIKFGNVTDVNQHDVPYISNQNSRIDNCNLLKTGDIVIADTAEDFTAGKATEIYNPNKLPVVAGLHTIPCKSLFPFAQGYLGQFLNSPAYHNQLFQWMLGAKVYSINKRDIVKTDIHYPVNLEEQQKIADFLSAVDNQINIQRQRIETMELQKKGLLDKVFSQELRFKLDDGSDYPDWEESIFDKLAKYKKGPFGSALKKSIFVPKSSTTVKVYEQENAIAGTWIFSRYYITSEYFQRMTSFKVESGDLIVSCAGTIGCLYELPVDAEQGIINQALMRVRVNTNIVNKKMFTLLFQNMIREYEKKYCLGSTLKNMMPFKELKNIKVLLPCPKEQRKIADFFTAIDNQIDIEKQRLATMETIKKGLLQQMFC